MKQCYNCFFFIDRLCRLLPVFRPGQDAKLIVFFFFKKLIKRIYKKKKRINNVIIVFFYRSTLSTNFYFPFLFFKK